MRAHSILPSPARSVRRAVAVLVSIACLSQASCIGWVRGTTRGADLAPSGLSRSDDAFRRALVTGGYALAVARAQSTKSGAPDDALLRALYRGTAAYYAGDVTTSASAFAEADRLSESRLTHSLSRSAFSVVANDRVLPYVPTRTERLFIRYYAMHAFLAAGDRSAAAVEARRLGRMLEDAGDATSPAERTLHATLRDAAGSVFEAAGDSNDALVSYRNAGLLRGRSRSEVDTLSLRPARGDSATLVVFVESGFVAHRESRSIVVNLDSVPTDSSAADSLARDAEDADSVIRSLNGLDSTRVNRPIHRRTRSNSFVRIAWPELVRSWLPGVALALVVRDDAPATMAQGADVSDALDADFGRDRPWQLARAITRTAARVALTESLREKHGDWAGALVGVASSAIDRADTRSWQLLPASLTAIRITVPAGRTDVAVRVGEGLEALNVRIAPVTLQPGETRVVSARVWRTTADMAPPIVATHERSRDNSRGKLQEQNP